MGTGGSGDYWKTAVNPQTGKAFGSEGDYWSWATGSETPEGTFKAGGDWQSPWSWSSVGKDSSVRNYNGSFDFTLDPGADGTAGDYGGGGWGAGQPIKIYTTNQTIGDQTYHPGDIVYGGDPGTSGSYATQQTGQWNPTEDYGLGADYTGIMPVGSNQAGQPDRFFTLTAGGGGQIFNTADEAKAARDEFWTWYQGQHQVPGSSTAAQDPTTAASSTVQTNGQLANPGDAETRYANDAPWYDSPTEAQQAYDRIKGKPTEAEQTMDNYRQLYSDPNTDESKLYDAYAPIFSDPNYLDDYYSRQANKARVTLDRRASSGGWEDSAAAARATAGIGQDFADRAIAAKQGWATTGMGLAGAADTSRNAKATTGMGLAQAADTAANNRIGTAAGVDATTLGRKTAGMTSAVASQNAKQGRLGGALSSQAGIADDMANLQTVFSTAADQQKFATDMASIQAQLSAGQINTNQAYAQAMELSKGMQVLDQYALNYYIMGKLGNKTNTGV